MNKTKIVILLTVFIDVLGIGIVIPILPFYVSSFGGSALVVTTLFAVYSLFSFFSAPIIGALSDRYGRRPLLIGSIFSTAIGWFIFASAPSILFLFIGRIVDGIMAGNLPIAQSFLSDISKDAKERTANFGLIGAAFGIGFIVGPLIGGVLGKLGHSVPFWFVGILALVNAILAYFILPETNKTLNDKPISLNPFKPIVRALGNVNLRSNYIAWFLFGLAIASYQGTFSLYLRDVFGFDELIGGLMFGVVGVIIAFNQGFAMKHFWLKHFKEPNLELGMIAAFIFGFVLLSVNLFWVFCVALLFTTFGQSVLRVVMNSQVVGQSPPQERGEVLGVMSSIVSLSMVISPIISGFVYDSYHALPFVFGAFYLAIAFVILYRKRRALSAGELPDDVEMNTMV